MTPEVAVHGKDGDLVMDRDRHHHQVKDDASCPMAQQHLLMLDHALPEVRRVVQERQHRQISPGRGALACLLNKGDEFRTDRMTQEGALPLEELPDPLPAGAGTSPEIVHPRGSIGKDAAGRDPRRQRRGRPRNASGSAENRTFPCSLSRRA